MKVIFLLENRRIGASSDQDVVRKAEAGWEGSMSQARHLAWRHSAFVVAFPLKAGGRGSPKFKTPHKICSLQTFISAQMGKPRPEEGAGIKWGSHTVRWRVGLGVGRRGSGPALSLAVGQTVSNPRPGLPPALNLGLRLSFPCRESAVLLCWRVPGWYCIPLPGPRARDTLPRSPMPSPGVISVWWPGPQLVGGWQAEALSQAWLALWRSAAHREGLGFTALWPGVTQDMRSSPCDLRTWLGLSPGQVGQERWKQRRQHPSPGGVVWGWSGEAWARRLPSAEGETGSTSGPPVPGQARGLPGLARKPVDRLGKEQSGERCLSLKSPEHRKVAPCPMAQTPWLLRARDLRSLLAQVLRGTKKKRGGPERGGSSPCVTQHLRTRTETQPCSPV